MHRPDPRLQVAHDAQILSPSTPHGDELRAFRRDDLEPALGVIVRSGSQRDVLLVAGARRRRE